MNERMKSFLSDAMNLNLKPPKARENIQSKYNCRQRSWQLLPDNDADDEEVTNESNDSDDEQVTNKSNDSDDEQVTNKSSFTLRI